NGWRNVYNTKSGFMTPRKNGDWLTPFDPSRVDNNYTEANAWQYSFAVPQLSHKMNEMNKVSRLFNSDSKTTGREQSDITGMLGQYAQGNEPSHHIPYLFDNLDSTKKYVKKICNELYKPKFDGLCGNEDCGQMSAWYVFSAIGFYPAEPFHTSFQYGNILFDSVKVKSDNYNFTIYKDPNIFTKSKKFQKYLDDNGLEFIPSNSFYLMRDEFTIVVGYDNFSGPSLSDKSYNYYFPTPILVQSSQRISDSLNIQIFSNFDQDLDTQFRIIYYQLNNGPLVKYRSPFILKNNVSVRAFETFNVKHPDYDYYFGQYKIGYTSDTVVGNFYKKPNNFTIKINSIYNPQYTADGDEGLIDGLLGETDWRKGRWQGYQSQDFEAIVDLKEVKNVNCIIASFLQDTRSWILMPTQVIFYGSVDGINYKEINTKENEITDSNYTAQRIVFRENEIEDSFRFVKVKAINYGKLPQWHQGAGGDAFIFIDEITIK
ncbi:MAG: glycoside hydrolase domain-containing protein, partial [Bacteroidia bacterium]